MNNYGFQTKPNEYNNYYNQTDNNLERSQDKNITNKAKELIRTFKNQYLINNKDNNQRILTTEINQIPQNYTSNQLFPDSNRPKYDINSYEYNFNNNLGIEQNTPIKQNYMNNNIDIMNQENAKLKKQLIDLLLENKNLQNKINNNITSYPSPILFNNDNFIRPERNFRAESETNINIYSNNNMLNMPPSDKKFLEESIESIIKTNMKYPQKNERKSTTSDINRNKKAFIRDNNTYKTNTNFNPSNLNAKNFNITNYNYQPNSSKKNKNENIYNKTYNNNINTNLNNINSNLDNNNDKFLTIMNDYNQLLEDFKSNKMKLDSLQHELEIKKNISNKYKALNNNYIELQNRNKELIITIQKMKSDNTVLTKHIEDLNKLKRNLESNLNKIKNKNRNKSMDDNNNNINELKILRNKNCKII